LMWIAQFGDFMSMTEFEELGKLLKLRNYKWRFLSLSVSSSLV
jgi:hypothetical protein